MNFFICVLILLKVQILRINPHKLISKLIKIIGLENIRCLGRKR